MYLLRDLGLDVPACFAAANLINSSWALRPFWGYLSDRIGNRNKQLTVLFLLAGVLWLTVQSSLNIYFVITLLVLCELSVAVSITVADAYVIKIAKHDGIALPRHHRFRIAGKIAASFIGGRLLSVPDDQRMDRIHLIFTIQSVVFFLVTLFSYVKLKETDYVEVKFDEEGMAPESPPEEKTPEYDESISFFTNIYRLINSNPSIRSLIVYLTILAALPDAGTSISYFLIGPMRLTPMTMAIVDAIKGVCDFLGTYIDQNINVPRVIYTFSFTGNLLAIPTMILICRTSHFENEWILFISTAIASYGGSMLATATSVHAAKASPAGKEAGSYNGIINVPMIGQIVGFSLSYFMTKYFKIDHDEFTHLPEFFAVTAFLSSFMVFFKI